MRKSFWKHSLLILTFGAIGGLGGVVLGCVACSVVFARNLSNSAAADGFSLAASGVSGIFLYGTMELFEVVMGGVTGCAVVHLFGRYRLAAKMTLLILGLGGGALTLLMGFDFARKYGRESALAIFGVYFVWAIVLACFAVSLFAFDLKHAKGDLGP